MLVFLLIFFFHGVIFTITSSSHHNFLLSLLSFILLWRTIILDMPKFLLFKAYQFSISLPLCFSFSFSTIWWVLHLRIFPWIELPSSILLKFDELFELSYDESKILIFFTIMFLINCGGFESNTFLLFIFYLLMTFHDTFMSHQSSN